MRLAESLGRYLAWEKAIGIKSSFKCVLYDWYPTVSNQYLKSQLNSGFFISLLVCEEPFTPTRFVWNTNMAATVSMFLANVTASKNALDS